MPSKVFAWRSQDGQTFNSEAEATRHEENLAAEPLAERLSHWIKVASDDKKTRGAALVTWIRENENDIRFFMRKVT